MNNIDIANGIVFQKMAISKDSFDDRLICQKKIYLLQALGTDLGYAYNWYVRGPYSPSLTNYVYTNLDVLENNDFSKYKLSKKAQDNVDKVNGLINSIRQDFYGASWYEILASLLYIYNNKESWGIKNSKEELFDTLINAKPQYTKEQCGYAFNVLENNGFIPMEA